jgi:hypothetical protein
MGNCTVISVPEIRNLVGSVLAPDDYEKLEASSWIPRELAQQALLRRVTSAEGADIVGRPRAETTKALCSRTSGPASRTFARTGFGVITRRFGTEPMAGRRKSKNTFLRQGKVTGCTLFPAPILDGWRTLRFRWP